MSPAPTLEALAPLRAEPDHSAILLDIDGTIAPIVQLASDAHVPEATRRVLAELARRFRLLACVSGRQASQARAMVGLGSITYVGAHGAELLEAGWTEAHLAPEASEWAERMGEFVSAVDTPALRTLRVRIEDKRIMAAFHWRGAPDDAAAETAVSEVAAAAERAGLAPHWGRKVLEVRPPVAIDKGTGIRALLDGAGIAHALYVGDDNTDLDAFRALMAMREEGLLRSVVRAGVRSDEGPAAIVEEADLVLDGTDGVLELLVMLAES